MDLNISRRVQWATLHLLVLICGCLPTAVVAQNVRDLEGVNSSSAIATANTAFAVDLYQRIAKDSAMEGKNFFYSPFSISMGLAMLSQGARGHTLEQIATVTHFSDALGDIHPNNLDPIHASMNTILQALLPAKPVNADANADEWKRPYVLSINNSMSVEKTMPINAAFDQTLQKYYGVGRLVAADFAHDPEGQRARINQQSAVQANQKIQDSLPPQSIDQDTLLVLTNVADFKGGWRYAFNEANTTKHLFRSGSKDTRRDQLVPMMHDSPMVLPYFGDNRLQAVALPYQGAEAGKFDLSMVVLLPLRDDGLPQVEALLSTAALEHWIGAMSNSAVDIHLPKFKSASNFRLNEPLSAAGMSDAFSGTTADFSGISPAAQGVHLHVKAALHQASIDVQEKGTEAVATTTIIGGAGGRGTEASRPPRPVLFRADHPFIYLIYHHPSRTVLFIGRMLNPLAQ